MTYGTDPARQEHRPKPDREEQEVRPIEGVERLEHQRIDDVGVVGVVGERKVDRGADDCTAGKKRSRPRTLRPRGCPLGPLHPATRCEVQRRGREGHRPGQALLSRRRLHAGLSTARDFEQVRAKCGSRTSSGPGEVDLDPEVPEAAVAISEQVAFEVVVVGPWLR